jgi:DNA processing protein
MSESLLTVLTLSRLPRIGRVRLRTILEQLNADGTVDLPLLQVIERVRGGLLGEIALDDLDRARSRADEILRACVTLDVTVHPFGWHSYPPQLARLREPPALLFSVGQFDARMRPRIAIVGTRRPTPWGVKTAKACARQIADSRGVVVSGLALGIDAAAHTTSVSRDAPTWAVLAHGLHTVSPSSNRELASQILEHGGALVSEYPPGEAARHHHFVERDRIQAGLSDAVLVIETGTDGGAMHTARFAHEAQVPVWVTFPSAKVQHATENPRDLPESQQGTWRLLNEKRALRVPTVKMLDRMLADLMIPGSAEQPASGRLLG